MVGREVVYDRQAVAIVKLTGPPRSGADGRHRRLVAYCGPTTTTAELVTLLRGAAEQLARSLPAAPVDRVGRD
jgi:hypothetical protein